MVLPCALQDCFKHPGSDLDKVRPPAETIDWIRSRLEASGQDLLRGTERIDRGRLDIPVFVSHCGLDAVRLVGKSRQMGKGATSEQAEASALMELAERICLARYAASTEPRPRNSVVGPTMELEALAASVGDRGEDLPGLEPVFQAMPMQWVPSTDLAAGAPLLLPFDWFHRIHESNGAAAGNTLEEAALQGACELVERHVASLVIHERLETPWIRTRSLDHPVAADLVEKLTAAGIKLYLKDFTLNTGIPTVGAIAFDPERFPEQSELVFTAGTATSPGMAVVRAVTEVAQLAGDFLSKTRYQPTLPRYETLEEARYLIDTVKRTDLSSLPDISNTNLRVELERVAHALARMDIRLHLVDLTDPMMQVPVVFMVAPGAHLQERTRKDGLLFHFSRLAALMPTPADAIAWTGRLLETFPGRFEPAFFAGHAMERAGRPGEALGLFRQALGSDPDPDHLTSIHCHIGACLRDLGDLDGALRALQAATALPNAQKEAFQVLGHCRFLAGQYYEAVNAFGEAIQRDANSAIDHANMAACMRELGHRTEAIELYRIALRLDPSLDAARKHLERLTAAGHTE